MFYCTFIPVMWWPFKKKKKKPEKGSVVEERWAAPFSARVSKEDIRFKEEEDKNYKSFLVPGALVMRLKRRNVFAWTVNEYYRYRNFVLSADIVFSPGNGYSSGGIAFRYLDEHTYYHVLVSTKGMFRFDVVFNGTPKNLIPWTEYGKGEGEVALKVLARGTFFAIFVNDEWVGEIDDITIDTGYFALVCQNYQEKEEAEVRFSGVEIVSGLRDVEDFYDERIIGARIPPDNIRRLGARFFDVGQYNAALYQMDRYLKVKEPGVDDLLLLARLENLVGRKEDALETIEKCLDQNPKRSDCILEKAGILYGLNRFSPLKDFLNKTAPLWHGHAAAWGIMGNALDALGDFDESYNCYNKASGLDPENGIYLYNAARVLEKSGKKNISLDLYSQAAELFFKEENFPDLEYTLSCIHKLDKDNVTLLTIRGKLLFQDGKMEEAEAVFKDLEERSKGDSSVKFLHAVILSSKGDREAADRLFSQVVDEEPEYYLYWFRYAENLYFLGRDASIALERARDLRGDDPWILNLQGLIYMEQGDYERACSVYEGCLPMEEYPEILINYSQALFETGKVNEALEILGKGETGAVLNQKGNLLASLKRFDEAEKAYKKAIGMEPLNNVFKENYIDLLLGLDRILDAEEILARLLEKESQPSLLVKAARIAALKGEFTRAEVAYQEALRIDSKNEETRFLYAGFLVERHKFSEASRLIEGISLKKAEYLKDIIRRETQNMYECSMCHRQWWVPKVLPETGSIRVHGEPAPESPAGKCSSCGKVYCVSCAKDFIKESRFTCPECGVPLKLSERFLRYLAAEYAR